MRWGGGEEFFQVQPGGEGLFQVWAGGGGDFLCFKLEIECPDQWFINSIAWPPTWEVVFVFFKIQYLQTCEFGLDNPLLQIFNKLVNIFQIEVSKQVIIFP